MSGCLGSGLWAKSVRAFTQGHCGQAEFRENVLQRQAVQTESTIGDEGLCSHLSSLR